MEKQTGALLGLACASLFGCAETPVGYANFSFVTRGVIAEAQAERLGHIDERRCMQSALLIFAWGKYPDHESLIDRALREHGADALTNAHVDITSIPLILYNRVCTRIEGDLIRFKRATSGGAS